MNRKTITLGDVPAFFDVFRGNGTSSNFNTSRDFLNAFQAVNYIGTYLSIIGKDISRLNWKICDSDGGKVDAPQIKKLFLKPTEGMNWSSFVTTLNAHLQLDGNAFIFKGNCDDNIIGMGMGKPDTLCPLIPSLVKVISETSSEVSARMHTNEKYVRYYRADFLASQKKIPPILIEHVKDPSPFNVLRGMGIIERNQSTLDADRLTSIFNNAFFNNGAKTNVVVTPDKKMGPKEFSIFKTQFNEEYTGRDNWWKPFFAPFGSTIQPLSLKHSDVEYIEQRKLTKADIAEMVQMPAIIRAALDGTNYDSAGEQIRVYYWLTIPRYTNPIEEALTNIVKLFDQRLEFRFILPDSIDRKMMSELAKQAYDSGTINGNEYREMIGLDPDDQNEHLNTYYVTINRIPVDMVRGNFEPDPMTEPDKIMQIEGQKKASAKAMLFHFRARSTKNRAEKKVVREVKDFYRGMEKRVLDGVDKGFSDFVVKFNDWKSQFTDEYSIKALMSDCLSEEKTIDDMLENKGYKALTLEDIIRELSEKEAAHQSGKRFITSTITLGLKDMNDLFELDIDTGFTNVHVRTVVEALSIKYADMTINSRRDELKKILISGLEDGKDASQIKADFQTHFQTLNGPNAWRADRIARTETRFAYDQAAKIGYTDAGVKRVQVVGCKEPGDPWDCDADGSRGTYPVSKMDQIKLKPNHTGSIVPVL